MGILRNTRDGDGLAAGSQPAGPLAPQPAAPIGLAEAQAALAGMAPIVPAAATQPPTPPLPGRSELEHRRDTLAEQVAELHWDLGGLAYEMAIRDHFRLDVLVRRAAVLQERDAELAEVERMLRMQEHSIAGSCPGCAAPHSRGALFCWQCGVPLMERLPSSAVTPGE